MRAPKRAILLLLISPGLLLMLSATTLQGRFFSNGSSSTPTPLATPTFDRLARPTLPALPRQADLGAQVYWANCLPCHGERGQGLTEEFRQTYPPGEQYCWARGCHGPRPYESGFTLPTSIPPVIAPNGLAKFQTAGSLHAYIAAAMPWWKPGSLSEEDYWAVTAFLLRANGVWRADEDLGQANADRISIPPIGAYATPTSMPVASVPISPNGGILLGALVAAAAVILLVRLRKVRPPANDRSE